MRPHNFVCIDLLWMVLLLPQVALAQAVPVPIPVNDIITNFNAVIWNNFETNPHLADTEGPVVVGNLIQPTGFTNSNFNNEPNFIPGVNTATLPFIPGTNDSVRFGGLNVAMGGTVSCGGPTLGCKVKGNAIIPTNAGSPNIIFQNPPPGGTEHTITQNFNIGDFTSSLNSLQAGLSGLSKNVDFQLSADQQQINFVLPSPGVLPNNIAIFSISNTQLQGKRINFENYNPAETVIIDVTGNNYTYSGAPFNGGITGVNTGCSHGAKNFCTMVVWNFGANAARLDLSNWSGAVLASNADVNLTFSAINGFLYSKNFFCGVEVTPCDAGSELHHYPFTGSISQFAETPEPSAWLMLALGVAGLTLLGWRRASCEGGALL